MPAENLRICVLGQQGSGKSSLTLQFTQSHFPSDFDPTVEDIYTRQLKINGNRYELHILDTAVQDDYSPLKDVQFKEADGFLIVYDISNLESFVNVSNSYRHILRVKGEMPPTILIGNKADLVHERLVPSIDAEELATEFGIERFIETSAKNNDRVEECFMDITKKIISNREQADLLEYNNSSSTSVPKSKSAKQLHQKTASTVSEVKTLQKHKTFTIGASLEGHGSYSSNAKPDEEGKANETVSIHRSLQSKKKEENVQSQGGGCCIVM